MNRRDFTRIAPALALGASNMAAEPTKSGYVELRTFKMHNSAENQSERTHAFLEKGARPALERNGIGPFGFFGSAFGEGSPSILTMVSFPSLAAMEKSKEALAADKEYQSARADYYAKPGGAFVSMECSLLRSFDGWPKVTPPPTDGRKSTRIFELRTYQSATPLTLARKIGMFNAGESAIFARLGMLPVFFAETIYGTKMPNLTYMLSYDDFVAREKLWSAFIGDPEFQKLRVQPGLSDAEIVANISNSMYQGLPFSPVR